MKKKAFAVQAKEFIIGYLTAMSKASGEEITDACKKVGIKSRDDRAFGPIFRSLAHKKVIEKCGTCHRSKGHRTAGGIVWCLKSNDF